MGILRKTVGVLLLILAIAKFVGVFYLLTGEGSDKSTWWYTKQITYALTFTVFGSGLLFSNSEEQRPSGH